MLCLRLNDARISFFIDPFDSGVFSWRETTEVLHVCHELVVLHTVVYVRDEHLAIIRCLDTNLWNVTAIIKSLMRLSGIHPHFVCRHPSLHSTNHTLLLKK